MTAWALSTEGTIQSAVPLGGLWLTPSEMVVGTKPAFRIEGQITDLSAELRASLIHPDHASALHLLHADLDKLALITADPLSHAAARILLVHRWRRIVLRFPDLPQNLLPESLAMRDPRSRVAEVYRHLTPAAEDWLDMADGEMLPMPAPDDSLGRRFGQQLPA